MQGNQKAEQSKTILDLQDEVKNLSQECDYKQAYINVLTSQLIEHNITPIPENKVTPWNADTIV